MSKQARDPLQAFMTRQRLHWVERLTRMEQRIRKRKAELGLQMQADWDYERRAGRVPMAVRRFGLDYYDRGAK